MRTSRSKLNNPMLTMDNIKMHERQIQDANHKFYPRINKLVDMANKKVIKGPNNLGRMHGASTNFTGTFSIFDALYDLESLNSLPKLHHE